jgi:hypothetical protein
MVKYNITFFGVGSKIGKIESNKKQKLLNQDLLMHKRHYDHLQEMILFILIYTSMITTGDVIFASHSFFRSNTHPYRCTWNQSCDQNVFLFCNESGTTEKCNPLKSRTSMVQLQMQYITT